jgi:hypothetical protein
MCTNDDIPTKHLESFAKNIFKDYIMGGSMFSLPPNEIVLELREGMSINGEICFELNEMLFYDLYMFTVGGLEVYYDLFKQSNTCK